MFFISYDILKFKNRRREIKANYNCDGVNNYRERKSSLRLRTQFRRSEYDFVIKQLAPEATRELSASYGGTSIQLSEYHEVNISPAPPERKALFVSRDRPRFDLARNQKAGCCMTRRTACGAYPVNEIVLARAALAPQVQQRTMVKEGRTRSREVGYTSNPSESGECGLSHVSRHISNFTSSLLFLQLFLLPLLHLLLLLATIFPSPLFPYLAVFRVSDFPSLLPFAKVVVR